MSQVKKYQGGSGPGGIQSTTPSALTFKVNGNEYKTDEQALRDKFNPIFSQLVQKGEAHEGDRDKWISAYEGVISNAKQAPYDLNSSAGKLYNGQYEGHASNQSLGLNEDGSTARKTKLGNLLSRGSKNPAQMTSMLDSYLGDSVIGDYNTSQADAKAKALAEADKNTKLAQDNAKNFAAKFHQGFGERTYGADLNDESAAKLIYSKWYDDKTTSPSSRYTNVYNDYASRAKDLFNPQWDAQKDYLKQNGFDLDARRTDLQKAGWDNGQQKFLGKYAKPSDLMGIANVFDTIGADSKFWDKSAYDKAMKANATTGGPATAPGTGAAAPLTEHGGLFTDGNQYWKDKNKSALQTGFDSNGHLYDGDGRPLTDWYIHDGDPGDSRSGWYAKGVRNGKDQAENRIYGVNYMNALGKNPANEQRLKGLTANYSNIVNAYRAATTDNPEDPSSRWLTAGANQNTSDGTYNVWAKQQAAGQARKQTRDITANYQGLNGRANVQAYTSNDLNAYGAPNIYHMVTLANHKQFYGAIQKDMLGNVTGMVDPNNKPIVDHDLAVALKGTTYDASAKNDHWDNTTYEGTSNGGSNTSLTQQKDFISGGFLRGYQVGGSIKAAGTTSGTGDSNVNHSATVGDFQKAATDPGFHVSGADKAELAALGLNLGSLATSIFGGGGAGVAAGLGAAGTATQYGADVAKHGFNWGDAGSALVGLGLDAASIVPGLGILSEGAKVTKTLAKVARFAVPALQAYGLYHASGIFMDVMSGKKGIKDLNVDDMRALTQGITAITGGARGFVQKAGTEVGKINSVTLKDGSQVQLDEPGLNAINSATDKASAMKDVVARITKQPVADVQLASKTKLQAPTTWKPWEGFGMKGQTDNTNLVTTSTGRTPIDPETIKGDGLVNIFKRYAANKAQMRDLNVSKPNIDPKYQMNGTGDIDQTSPGAAYTRSPMTMWGDNFQKPRGDYNAAAKASGVDEGTAMGMRREDSGNYTASSADPTYTYEPGKTATVGDIPDTRRMYGSMFGLRSIDNERSISFSEIRNRVNGLQGTKSTRDQLNKFMGQEFQEGTFEKQMQDQIKQAVSDKQSKGYVKFQYGGIFKLANTFKSLGGQISDVGNDPFGVNRVAAKAQGLDPTPLGSLPNTGGVAVPNYGRSFGASDGSNTFNLPAIPKFSLNPVTVSELGRALYTSNFNKGIDTRVERPMLTAPMEIPIAVRGNMYAQNVANTQADNLVRNSQQFKTSDGSLQMLGNLEAERQASGIRMQGAMQNNQALEQSRLQAQQNAMQNVQARTNVANENVQTNARATQAERQANNEKRSMVQQPLLDFWKDQDYKSYIQGQRNRDLDTQIGGLGEESMTRNVQQQLSQAMYKVWTDPSVPDNERQTRYQQLANQAQALQSKLSKSELQLRKDPYSFNSPGLDYYTQGIDMKGLATLLGSGGIPVQKDGGSVTLQKETIKANARTSDQIARTQEDSIKEGLQEETKKQIEAMKDISDLIKMALK